MRHLFVWRALAQALAALWLPPIAAGETVRDAKITHKCWLDVHIVDEEVTGRIVIGLFGDVVPKTVRNFYHLCKGDKGKSWSVQPHRERHFKNSTFHRIIPNFMIQGGDYTKGDGTGGEAIFGQHFEDENFRLKHTEPGILSMANAGPDTNGSQFFISTVRVPWLDGKHVVFGRVIRGMSLVTQIEAVGSEDGTPTHTVTITDSGTMKVKPEGEWR